MEVTQDLSFIHLIANASVLVQLVMGLLLLVSLTFVYRSFYGMRIPQEQTLKIKKG